MGITTELGHGHRTRLHGVCRGDDGLRDVRDEPDRSISSATTTTRRRCTRTSGCRPNGTRRRCARAERRAVRPERDRLVAAARPRRDRERHDHLVSPVRLQRRSRGDARGRCRRAAAGVARRAGPGTLAAPGQVVRRGTRLLLRGTGHRAMTALVTGMIFGAVGSAPLRRHVWSARADHGTRLAASVATRATAARPDVPRGARAHVRRARLDRRDWLGKRCPRGGSDGRSRSPPACCSCWRLLDPLSRTGCEDGEPHPPRSPRAPVPWLGAGAACTR